MSSLGEAPIVQSVTYRRLVLRKRLILLGLAVLLIFSVLLDLALGPARYSLSEVLGALISPETASAQVRVVMWDIRLPVSARRWGWPSAWRCFRWRRNTWCRSTRSSWRCSRRC
jgi:hypothetical protein